MLDQAGIMMSQGKKIACERISGVNDNMYQSHYHNYYELYFLEDGKRYHQMQDKLYFLQSGELMLFSPYKMHHSYGEKDVPFRRIILYFRTEEIFSDELRVALDAKNGMYKLDYRRCQAIHRYLELMLREQDYPGEFHEEYQRAVLNLILYDIIRQEVQGEIKKPESQSRIDRVVNYIHLHYAEDISLNDLAKKFYISPNYLCREFKQQTNSTIIRYLNVTRIMNAQRKLMETDKNITEICRETGFANLTHFNRVFKSVANMTPSEYRKRRNQ